jgi:hypothetical protein
LWNESFFSAPQLKRDSLGSAIMIRNAALFLVILPVACMAARDIRDGEAIVRRSITAAANGQTLAGVQIQLPESLTLGVRQGLSAPYTLQYVDNELAGTSLKDVVSTGWMLWNVQYVDGRRWEAEALRRDTVWIVVLRPTAADTNGTSPRRAA